MCCTAPRPYRVFAVALSLQVRILCFLRLGIAPDPPCSATMFTPPRRSRTKPGV